MGTLKVSDHAIVQFLRRQGRLDIDELIEEIAAPLANACSAAERMHISEFAVRRGDGWKFIVKNNVLVTCFDVKADERRAADRRHGLRRQAA